MRRRFRLLAFLGLLAFSLAAAPAGAEGASPVECARTTTTATAPDGSATAPPAGGSCWVDVLPYPFGDEGEPVDASPGMRCAPVRASFGAREDSPSCYQTVTSMAFRTWNRGLAATALEVQNGQTNPYGVWIFNGTRWFPDPTFPGHKVCPGTTIVWAGKLDYWLVGGPESGKWPRLCRFDGIAFAWEPLEVPKATLERVTPTPTPETPNPQPEEGAVKSASCLAWNDCWFFGTYGTVLHWDGKALSDASPDRSQGWLQGEYTAAVARQDPAGNAFGAAVGGTSEQRLRAPLPAQPDGAPPPQLYSSSGGLFSPLAFAPETIAQTNDPYRTDLVAVDFDSAGVGWAAGNPAGLRLGVAAEVEPRAPDSRAFSSPSPQPAPLEPVSSAGAALSCAGPPSTLFSYTPFPKETKEAPQEGAFLWSSIGVFPTTGEALAGGRVRRAAGAAGAGNEDAVGEPAIAQASCDGATTVTRFRSPDPWIPAQPAPADRSGNVTAVAANATNDAWAATTSGRLVPPASLCSEPPEPPQACFPFGINERPHMYRLSDGQPPAAPEGDDNEFRPREEHLDAPIFVLEPPPPPELPPPAPIVTQTHKKKLPPAIYRVRTRLHREMRHGERTLSLYLIFKVRRPVTIGAQALRHGRVVSHARPRRFQAGTGQLILKLDRRRWPTKIRFVG